MNVLETLERLVAMFKMGELPAIDTEELLRELDDAAISKPKAGAAGFTAEMVGYKAAYLFSAAVARLGPNGLVDVPLWGEFRDCTLPGKIPGVEVTCELVCYFPTLHTARIVSATGRGKDYGDAMKAATTTARKRALALVGIGWIGYTDEIGGSARPEDMDGERAKAPPLPGRAAEDKKWTPPATTTKAPPKPAEKEKEEKKPIPAPQNFADAANAAAGQDYETAFLDVFELLTEDGVISRSEKGQSWFRDRAQDWGFFSGTADGAAKVQLKEKAEALHLAKLGQLHAAYKDQFGADEKARRDWLEKTTGKRSTKDCTLNQRIYAAAKLADMKKSGF